MAEAQQQSFEIDLGDKGGRLVFKTADELRQWNKDELNRWVWLAEAGRPMTEWLVNARHEFHNQIEGYQDHWRRYQATPSEVAQAHRNIKSYFEQYPLKGRLLLSNTPAASFVFQLKEKRGDKVAAGAYAAVLNSAIQSGGQTQSEFFEGIVEAFLFKREIEWTASSHKQELDRLKNQYDGEIGRQDARFKQLEETNRALNSAFDAGLKEKTEALQKLHTDQTGEFTKLIEKHVQNLAAIEKTYDQKLALQKPVRYWHTKEGYHTKRAKWFGISALLTTLVLAGGMAWLVHWIFSNLKADESPKHWQVGLLVIAAFFSVWLVRILVRMFFSHHHLATDAAERRTMILTYLSMSREGAEFTKDDKKLIVQHLFRSASDGLVKDDAAPPTLFELLTRK